VRDSNKAGSIFYGLPLQETPQVKCVEAAHYYEHSVSHKIVADSAGEG
jgi:hypothetical protein